MSTTNNPHDPPHDEMPTGVDPASVQRGYEEDVSNVSGIWAIPIAVAVFLVLGIVVAALSFRYFQDRDKDPLANPVASERNEAGINDRVGRIGRAGEGTELTDQPRLEGLPKRESGNGMTAHMTSRPVLKDANNPPYVHPEDLRASLQPNLQKRGWVDQGKVAQIPVAEAMKIAVDGHMFPVRKDPVQPMPSDEKANSGNAGRGLPAPVAPAPKPAH
jgi:hypothetical protein